MAGITTKCPICKQPVQAEDVEFPFCSERCRTIDLAKWASGEYVISSPVQDNEEQAQGENARDEDS